MFPMPYSYLLQALQKNLIIFFVTLKKKTEKYNKHISLPSTMLGELSPFEVAAGQVNLVIFPSPFIHV